MGNRYEYDIPRGEQPASPSIGRLNREHLITPEKERAPKLMVIMAHPDDAEQFLEPLIKSARAGGTDVSILVTTDGGVASDDLDREAVAFMRSIEQSIAAQVMDVKVENLGIPDTGVDYSREHMGMILRKIREEDPDVIITHSDPDYMADHTNTGKLVEWAVAYARVGDVAGVDNLPPPTNKTIDLYMADPQYLLDRDGQVAQADFIYEFSLKTDSFSAFGSHLSQMGKPHGEDKTHMQKTVEVAATRGSDIPDTKIGETKYGIGLRKVGYAGFPEETRLVDMLGDGKLHDVRHPEETIIYRPFEKGRMMHMERRKASGIIVDFSS